MEKREKKITMQDLARELNTTSATVSRALNNSPQIGEKMKERVKALADKYNFKPNRLASNLRTGRSKTIGIIVPYINRHFFSTIIHHIEDDVAAEGFNVMICQTGESFEKEKEFIDMLINQRVSGIIISLAKYTPNVEHISKALAEDIKVLQVDNVLKEGGTSYIKTKDREGAKATVLHLLEQGYRKIALFNGIMSSKIYQDRQQGFIEAHEEFGIKPNEDIFFYNTSNREEGKEAMYQLLEKGADFDAVFSSGDYAALGAYLVLKEKGINIPKEVGVTGFANEHFAELVSPSITSSEQHSARIGKLAAIQILEEINNSEAKKLQTSILPELIVRESSIRK